MVESIQYIKDQLKEAGFKLTPQREATIKILIDKKDDHMSAEEIYMRVREKNPDIGLATVYRTLEILTDLHITYRIVFDDGLARYDIKRDEKAHFHHHLVCRICGSIEEIHEDLLGPVEQIVSTQYHFQVDDHRLTFLGVCANCQNK